MVIFYDTRRFEITVTQYDDAWMAKILAFVPGRLYPTAHLMREVSTREEALMAIRRVWNRLFPEAAPLQWRDPEAPISPSIARRPRRPEGHQT